jgi:hypothetical protein
VTPTGLHQQGAHIDAVARRGRFRVPQEAGVDARVANSEGLAVDPHRPVVQRPDQVLGRVLEGEQVAAVLPALQGGGGDERLEGAVARPGAVARQRGVDPGDPLLDRGQRVGRPAGPGGSSSGSSSVVSRARSTAPATASIHSSLVLLPGP